MVCEFALLSSGSSELISKSSGSVTGCGSGGNRNLVNDRSHATCTLCVCVAQRLTLNVFLIDAGECARGILEATGMARPGHVSLRFPASPQVCNERGPCL